jgi:DNA sulfur modification protein DndD
VRFIHIQSLELKNFGSYKGAHRFDFSSSSGRMGYAIFGEIGRGKTTLINSIIWALYGEVETSVELEGRIFTKKRPVIDSDQTLNDFSKKWNLPLLNFGAYEEKDYSMSVSIKFEHKGSIFHLLRDAKSRKDRPRKSSDIAIQPHLSIDGRTVAAQLIQPEIEEIIPQKISKFFFVEVDSIKSYSALLFAGETSGGIVEDIEAILGMPALEHSKNDFVWLSEYQQKTIEGIQTTDKRNKSILRVLEGIDLKITSIRTDIESFGKEIDEQTKRIGEIDLELEEHPSAEEQLERLKGEKDIRTNLENVLNNSYERRRRLMSKDAWKILLQSKISHLNSHYSNLRKTKVELSTKLTEIELSCNHSEIEINKGGAKCKVCGNVSEGLTEKERTEKADELVLNRKLAVELRDEIELLGNPEDDLVSLSAFRDSRDSSEIDTLEDLISRTALDLFDTKKRIKDINDELQKADVLKVRELQQEKIACIELRGSLKDERKVASQALSEIVDERVRTASNLKIDETSSPAMVRLSKTKKIADWLTKTFDETLSVYKKNARKSVEKRASDAWLSMTPEPEKYTGVKINERWQTEVLSSNGKSLPIGNPGHRQTLAVCIFDGLRKTSGRKFPTFYDNPGSNISDVVLQKMAKHFWDNTDDQIVMLSHGGGLKKQETMNLYGDKLAKAWELSYSPENTTTSVKEVIE